MVMIDLNNLTHDLIGSLYIPVHRLCQTANMSRSSQSLGLVRFYGPLIQYICQQAPVIHLNV